MHTLIRLALVPVLTIALMLSTLLMPIRAEAMPEILPLDKVKSGMTGVAYTVIDNSGVIEPFNVDIIGLMDNGKGSAKMIMAKASGEVIEKTGGVLQGMSGSPIYIDGKLVGALAAGLKEMSPYTFFITPIESMLPMWSMPDRKAENKYQQVTLKAPEEEKSESDVTVETNENDKSDESSQTPQVVEEVKETEAKNLEEKSASLFFDGFDNNGIRYLSNKLNINNFYATSTNNGETKIDYNAKLEPGSPVGVAVVYGDFSVGATGTVTAVDGKKILGFGHPFSHAGNVNFFMTDASIIGSVSGENGSGVKVANVGNIIGRINQDRDAGIAGILGSFPSVVPITVKIDDKSLGKSEIYNASIAYNENLIPRLGAAIAYTALSKTADSLAESTVDVNFTIKTNVVQNGKLERTNTFYNTADVGQVAVMELMQGLNLVCSNTAAESDIFGINVEMALDNDRRTASLVSAVPNKLKVKPGETVDLTVTLQPYRKKAETIVVPYTVPITMKEGPLTLDLHGGALVSVAQILANAGLSGTVTSTENNDVVKNYKEMIEEFLKTGKNNQIVVEPGAVAEPKSDRELKRDIERAKKAQEKAAKSGNKTTTSKETKVDTNYIIDNVIHTIINVDKI